MKTFKEFTTELDESNYNDQRLHMKKLDTHIVTKNPTMPNILKIHELVDLGNKKFGIPYSTQYDRIMNDEDAHQEYREAAAE